MSLIYRGHPMHISACEMKMAELIKCQLELACPIDHAIVLPISANVALICGEARPAAPLLCAHFGCDSYFLIARPGVRRNVGRPPERRWEVVVSSARCSLPSAAEE